MQAMRSWRVMLARHQIVAIRSVLAKSCLALALLIVITLNLLTKCWAYSVRLQTVGGIQSTDDNQFVVTLLSRIKRMWQPSAQSPASTLQVYFETEPTGEFNRIKIIRSSGASELDQMALFAVQKSAVPQIKSPSSLKFIATFDSTYSRASLNQSPPAVVPIQNPVLAVTREHDRQPAPSDVRSLAELPVGVYLYREPDTGNIKAFVQNNHTLDLSGNSALTVRNLPAHLLSEVLGGVLPANMNSELAPQRPRSNDTQATEPTYFLNPPPRPSRFPTGYGNPPTQNIEFAEPVQAWSKWHSQFADAVSRIWNTRTEHSGKALVNVTVTRGRIIQCSIVSSTGGASFQQSLVSVFRDLSGNPGLTFPTASHLEQVTFQREYSASPIASAPSSIHYPQYPSRQIPPPRPQVNKQGLATNKAYELAQMSNQALLNGDLERARNALEEACRYDPNNNSFTVHYNLGSLCERLQDYTAAKKAYSEAVEFTKDKTALANAYTQLGQISERLNDPDKAIDFLVKAQSYGKIDAAISLAEVYKSAGRIPEAILCLEEFIRKGAASPALQQAQATIESLRKADIGVGNPNSPDYLNGKRIQRWEVQRMPLKVFINQDIRNPFYKRHYTQMMQQALDAWCAASNNKIGWSESENADDADITVDWASFPESTAEAGITNASTFGRSASDRTFNKAAITIYTLRRDGSDVSDKEVNATCLHESGHALGLPHSANNQDIMFFANSPHCLGKLTKRDMETISKLYDDAAAVSK